MLCLISFCIFYFTLLIYFIFLSRMRLDNLFSTCLILIKHMKLNALPTFVHSRASVFFRIFVCSIWMILNKNSGTIEFITFFSCLCFILFILLEWDLLNLCCVSFKGGYFISFFILVFLTGHLILFRVTILWLNFIFYFVKIRPKANDELWIVC